MKHQKQENNLSAMIEIIWEVLLIAGIIAIMIIMALDAHAQTKNIVSTSIEDALAAGLISQEDYAALQSVAGLRRGEGTFVTTQTPEVTNAVKDAMRVQNLSDRPQPITVPVSNGVVTVEPQQITRLTDGSVGLSNANVTATLITHILPTPAPIPVKQDVRTAFTIQGIDDIEIKGILPESLDANNLDAVKSMIKSGELVAGQRLVLEQYQIGQKIELEKRNQLKSLILWSLVLLIPGTPIFVKCYNTLRQKSIELEEARKMMDIKVAQRFDALTERKEG